MEKLEKTYVQVAAMTHVRYTCDECGSDDRQHDKEAHRQVCGGTFRYGFTEEVPQIIGNLSFTCLGHITRFPNGLCEHMYNLYSAQYGSINNYIAECLIRVDGAVGELIARINRLEHKPRETSMLYCNNEVWRIAELLHKVVSGKYISLHTPNEEAYIYEWLYEKYYSIIAGRVLIGWINDKKYIIHPTKVLPRITKLMDCTVQFHN